MENDQKHSAVFVPFYNRPDEAELKISGMEPECQATIGFNHVFLSNQKNYTVRSYQEVPPGNIWLFHKTSTIFIVANF